MATNQARAAHCKYRRKGFWQKPENQFWKDNEYYKDNQEYFEDEFLPNASVYESLKTRGGTGSGQFHRF